MSAASSCLPLLLCRSKSTMENFEENNLTKDNLLQPQNIGDSCVEEDDVKATIKPRLSPLPRRRSSVSSDEGELEPPSTVARKVSFADAFGFDLVSVKEFDTWEVPAVSQNLTAEMENNHKEEYFLTPGFTLPSADGILNNLHAKKVILESADFAPNISSMKGIIRVLNVCYEKQIYVRMSLDDWQSYYDLLAEYIPDSCDGDSDQFSFNISLVTPYQKEGAKVEFCICYETPVGTFWDNNDGHNYILLCHRKEHVANDQPSDELADKFKKSCLKSAQSKEDEDLDVFEAESSRATEKYIPRIICSHDDTIKDNNHEENHVCDRKNNDAEDDLELFLNEHLMKARIISSEDRNYARVPEQPPNERQIHESTEYVKVNTCDLNQLKEHTSSENYSQISKQSNTSEVCSTLEESVQSLGVGKVIYTSVPDEHNFEAAEHSSQEFVSETEGNATMHLDDSSKQSNESKINSQDDTGNITMECSVISLKNIDSIINISDMTPETTSFQHTDHIQSTGNLDDNANPSCSENITDVYYFSVHNNERNKNEHKELPENIMLKHMPLDKDDTTNLSKDCINYIVKDNILSLDNEDSVSKQGQDALSFSPLDDKHDTSHSDMNLETGVFENTGSVKYLKDSDDSVPSFVLPTDIYLIGDGQKKDTNEEKTSENKILAACLSSCEDIETNDKVSSLVEGKENTDTQAEADHDGFQILPASISKQYYISTNGHSSSSKQYDHHDDKTYLICTDNKSTDLSKSERLHDFECPLLKADTKIILNEDENKDTIKVGDMEDFTDKDSIYKNISQTECSPVLVCDTSKNVEQGMSHTLNEMSESDRNKVTVGGKVIIALLTEEEGQSEIHTQGEVLQDHEKGSYIDVCQGKIEETIDLSEIETGSALKIGNVKLEEDIFSQGGKKEINRERIKEHHFDDIQTYVGVKGEDDREEIQSINTCKLNMFSDKNIGNVGNNHAFEDQSKIHFEYVSSNLGTLNENVEQHDIQYTDLDYCDTQSSSRFSAKYAEDFSTESEGEITADNIVSDSLSSTDEIPITQDNVGPSILISEPDEEIEAECLDSEEYNKHEEIKQYYGHTEDDHDIFSYDQETQSENIVNEPLSINNVSSKVFCFIMFVVFAGLMYHYDFLVCFLLYLFSLYWLYWEGDKNKTSIRKE
ncbi:protein phosphatase 1 regulatory subunit 3A [Rhinophrynus dorsalis]